MAAVDEKLEKEIAKIVESEGLELVHIDFKRAGGNNVLRIDIDKEGGVTIDDCTLISHQVSAWLDVEDAITTQYDLEVSSPGLDRKFYRESDYGKFIGRLVRVRTSAAVRGLHVIVGRLKSYDGEQIVVADEKMKKNNEYEIRLADIKETRLEPEF